MCMYYILTSRLNRTTQMLRICETQNMESGAVLHNISFFSSPISRNSKLPNNSRIVAVLNTPAAEVAKLQSTKTTQKDGWLNLVAINYLSQAVQSVTGLRNDKSGYDSLVEAASEASRDFGPIEQRELILKVLDEAIPRPFLAMARMLLPNSKFKREYFAAFTTLFFTWLMGPCEVRESELNGQREKNVVHIKKCRFLEESNCVGMCLNMCKMPSQTFIKDSFGMPVNMVPNFEDMSCEMIFGQEPPKTAEDPAFKQPCLDMCKLKKRHSNQCSN